MIFIGSPIAQYDLSTSERIDEYDRRVNGYPSTCYRLVNSTLNTMDANVVSGTKIEVYDFETGSIIREIVVSPGETIYESVVGFDGPHGNLEWIDEHTLKYGVYQSSIVDNGMYELLEYRTILIP
jgi:hypothetical protein